MIDTKIKDYSANAKVFCTFLYICEMRDDDEWVNFDPLH